MLDMCNTQSDTPCADCGKPARHECNGCGEFFCADSMSTRRKGLCHDCSFSRVYAEHEEDINQRTAKFLDGRS